MTNADLSDRTVEWRKYERAARSSLLKRGAYSVVRPLLSMHYRPLLQDRGLAERARWVMAERGFPLETRRKWVNAQVGLKDRTMLIQGTGSGWDLLTWLPFHPGRVVGVDAYSFERSWLEIRREASRRYGITPEIFVADLEHLPIETASVDVVCSDAVFEHCRRLREVMCETRRVLRPAGYVYAGYGPLWYCFGGDHFSGRGGLTHGFSHIELESTEYLRYFEHYSKDDEDAQSGGRYVELDLFSKLAGRDYLRIFRETGFRVVDLVLQISSSALRFRARWPVRFDGILEKCGSNVSADDLITFSHLVILQRVD